jgi:hypothetical protein
MIKKLMRALILALPLSIAYQTARADFVMFDGIAANMAMITMQHSVLENSLKDKIKQRGRLKGLSRKSSSLLRNQWI